MKAIFLNENIKGEKYFQIIDFLFSNSDLITFHIESYASDYSLKDEELLDVEEKLKYQPSFDLQKYIELTNKNMNFLNEMVLKIENELNQIKDDLLICYYDYDYGNVNYSNKSKIWGFKPTENVLRYLKSVNSLFDWKYDFPSDLCFYKEGICLMSTIAHEGYGYFYTNSIMELLKNLKINYELIDLKEVPKIRYPYYLNTRKD